MSLKKCLTVGIIGTILLGVILAVSITLVFSANNNLKETLTNQNKLALIVNDLEDMSSYLKNEARLYTFTGNERHFNNYNSKVEEKLFVNAEESFNEMGVPADITAYLAEINQASLTAAEHEYQAFDVLAAGDAKKAQELVLSDIYEEQTGYVYVLYDEFKEKLDVWNAEAVAGAEAKSATALTVILVVSVLFIVGIIGLLLIIVMKVKPIFLLTENSRKMADGDLTVELIEVKTKDEIGMLTQSFNTMIENLRSILKTVSDSSNEVAASSEQLLANSEQTNGISEKVLSSVEQISNEAQTQQVQMEENATVLGEVTVGIQQVADAASTVSDASNEAKERAEVGKGNLSNTVEQMNSIRESVDNTISVIHELSKHSREIEEFVTAITDISNQTNLLALNAAIEAARAGDSGKGFAVVADEVRKLAEQSNVSATRITEIIHSLQNKVSQTTEYMTDVTQKVKDGVETVNQTSYSFEDIMSSTMSVSNQITDVSAIAQQMAASAEQMTAIFKNIQSIATHTSDSSKQSVELVNEQYGAIQEITASSNMLAKLAETLNQQVAKFQL